MATTVIVVVVTHGPMAAEITHGTGIIITAAVAAIIVTVVMIIAIDAIMTATVTGVATEVDVTMTKILFVKMFVKRLVKRCEMLLTITMTRDADVAEPFRSLPTQC